MNILIIHHERNERSYNFLLQRIRIYPFYINYNYTTTITEATTLTVQSTGSSPRLGLWTTLLVIRGNYV